MFNGIGSRAQNNLFLSLEDSFQNRYHFPVAIHPFQKEKKEGEKTQHVRSIFVNPKDESSLAQKI